MHLERIYDEKLAQAGWVLGCQATGEALVVDPLRDPAPYLEAARRRGLRITRVTETHIHADFVSGVRELAAATGAEVLLSAEGGEDWSYRFPEAEEGTALHDGDDFAVGRVRVEVLHTPGHTPEHLTLVVTDGAADPGEPVGAFTGDFLFVGDVGRPDLLERSAGVAGASRSAAGDLFRSLRLLEPLPDHLQIWPGHGAGSACGRSPGSVPQSTLGYERRVGWAFQVAEEDAFVDAVLEGQPTPPAYFGRMKRMNRDGPEVRGGVPSPERLDRVDLTGETARDAIPVDVRGSAAFAAAHWPGSIGIPLNRSFTTWAGSLLSYDRPIVLVADGEESAREAARDLFLIGFDRVHGWIGPDVLAEREESEGALPSAPWVEAEDGARATRGGALILDVREPGEWEEERIPGAVHIPLAELPGRLDEVPAGDGIVVHCRSGARSAIAQSLLMHAGRTGVSNLRGGILEWRRRGLPVEEGPAP